MWAILAEVFVAVINSYAAIHYLSKLKGQMDNSPIKALLFNCLAINFCFCLLWISFELVSAALSPKTYEERAQVQLFTIFVILLNGDIYWMLEALLKSNMISQKSNIAQRVQLGLFVALLSTLSISRLTTAFFAGSLDITTWSSPSFALPAIVSLLPFTIWTITMVARIRQATRVVPAPGDDEQAATVQAMEVFAIHPVASNQIPTVHDLAWEDAADRDDENRSSSSISSSTENRIVNGSTTGNAFACRDLIFAPLPWSIMGAIRWLCPLIILLIWASNENVTPANLPLKTLLEYLQTILLWQALQAIGQTARIFWVVRLNYIIE